MNKVGYITYPEVGYTDIASESTWDSKKVDGVINDGTEVTIINSANGFYEIVSGKITGWVPQNRVSLTYYTAYIAYPEVGYTDIASESTWDSKKVGEVINDGTEITVINSANDFYEIVSGKITGWVPQSRVSPMYKTAYIAYPEVGYTDVTSESTWYSKVVGTIKDGTEVIIVNSADGFYQIINGNSMVWAPKNRVFSMYSTGYIDYPALGYTDIMSGPTWYSKCIGSINDGTKVVVINNAYGFYEIINGSSTGWVLGSRIALNNSPESSNAPDLLEQAAIMIALDEGFSATPYVYGVGSFAHSAGYGTHTTEFKPSQFPLTKMEAWNKLKEVLSSQYIPYCDKFISQYFGDSLTNCQKCAIYTFGYNLEGYVGDLVQRLSEYDTFSDTFGRFLIPASLKGRRNRSWNTFHNNKFNLFTSNYSVLPNQSIIETAQAMEMNS